MASASIENLITRILLEGGDLVKKQLDDIGKSGQKSLEQLDAAGKKGAAGITAADKAITRASVSFATASTSFGRIGGALGTLGTSFVTFAGAVGTAALALGGILTVLAPVATGLFFLSKSAADTTDKMRDAAIAAGTTVEKFTDLAFAAEQSGTSAEGLSRSLAVIGDAAAEAQAKGDRSSGAFAKMGVNLVDSAGRIRDVSDVFIDLAGKIAAIENPAERAAKVIELFGRRAGPQLVQLLSEGRVGLKAMAADVAKLGGNFTKAESEVGDKFNDALDRLGFSLTRLKVSIGLAFAPGFTELINNLADAVGAAIPFFKDLAESAAGQLQVVFEAIAAVLTNTLIPAFKLAAGALQLLADAFNAVFGTELKVADLVAFAAILVTISLAIGVVTKIAGGLMLAIQGIGFLIGSVLGIFLSFGSVISAVVSALATLAEIVGVVVVALDPIALAIIAVAVAIGVLVGWLLTLDWSGFTAGAADAWESIAELAEEAVAAVVAAWNSLPALVQATWTSIVAGAESAWNSITAAFNAGIAAINAGWELVKQGATTAWETVLSIAVSALDGIKSAIDSVISFMNRLYDAAVAAANAIAKAVGAGGGSSSSAPGKAAGGRVFGPGTSTSDSIPAYLSRDEWVIKAAAVKKYGHALFAALNGMRIPASALRRLLGYASGGPVSMDLSSAMGSFHAPALRMAEGGAVSEQRIRLDLGIPGLGVLEDLLAPADVADKLVKFALSEQIKSGGRKPGWYR